MVNEGLIGSAPVVAGSDGTLPTLLLALEAAEAASAALAAAAALATDALAAARDQCVCELEALWGGEFFKLARGRRALQGHAGQHLYLEVDRPAVASLQNMHQVSLAAGSRWPAAEQRPLGTHAQVDARIGLVIVQHMTQK